MERKDYCVENGSIMKKTHYFETRILGLREGRMEAYNPNVDRIIAELVQLPFKQKLFTQVNDDQWNDFLEIHNNLSTMTEEKLSKILSRGNLNKYDYRLK